jgi:hypothetical protein
METPIRHPWHDGLRIGAPVFVVAILAVAAMVFFSGGL